jgi:hypothetical protein
MSSIELLLALAAAAVQLPTACPAANGGVRLTGGQVIDGPVAQNAILAPDGVRRVGRAEVSSWDVAYVYAAGRQVHLLCEYAKRPPVIVKISRAVKTCRYSDARTRQSLACS